MIEKSLAKKTLIVQFFGGPGTGKSTMAARIFAELKENGYITELATEYAKDMVWQESFHVMLNQLYLFGKQHHRIWRLLGKVDIIVTDAPLLMGLVYGDISDAQRNLVIEKHNELRTVNFLLLRQGKYHDAGRTQTEKEAKKLDEDIENVLRDNDPFFYMMPADKTSIPKIMEYIESEITNY